MNLIEDAPNLQEIQVGRNTGPVRNEAEDVRNLPASEKSTIKLYLQEIGKTPLLKPSEEVELAALIQQGDSRAREKMIKANLRLVVKIAHDYANFGLPLLDLIS
ncbi:MAG TPA: sigma-70 factor domain-containing protein, partial [Oceanipulchritudo sp.]|nr:sigma-70 factor domain-containing protein [Oceanipulchritudo sp.]